MTPGALLLALAALTPGQAPVAELRFAVLGHLRGDQTGSLHYLLDEIVDEVARAQPDLLFLTGDMVFGDIHRTVDRAAANYRSEGETMQVRLIRLKNSQVWVEYKGQPEAYATFDKLVESVAGTIAKSGK